MKSTVCPPHSIMSSWNKRLAPSVSTPKACGAILESPAREIARASFTSHRSAGRQTNERQKLHWRQHVSSHSPTRLCLERASGFAPPCGFQSGCSMRATLHACARVLPCQFMDAIVLLSSEDSCSLAVRVAHVRHLCLIRHVRIRTGIDAPDSIRDLFHSPWFNLHWYTRQIA